MTEEKDSDGRKCEAEEELAELEGQFILRLPPSAATSLRLSLESGGVNLEKRLKIKIEDDKRHCRIIYDGWSLTGKVMDVPTVIECLKTLDRKVFYKTADICQILICEDEDEIQHIAQNSDEESPKEKDKAHLLPHGITAPLKNVRRRRFRKTLKKKSPEMPDHEREVQRLFRQDLEAISVRYELVSADEDKHIKPEGNDMSVENSMDGYYCSPVLDVDEADLFGEISSSAEESEEDEEDVVDLCEELMNHGVDCNDLNCPCADVAEALETAENLNDMMDIGNLNDIVETENASILQWESETAGENLGQFLKEQIMEEEKTALCEKADLLECQISAMQNKQRGLEMEIVSIENDALKERFQARIDRLQQEIRDMQAEYNDINTVLQEN